MLKNVKNKTQKILRSYQESQAQNSDLKKCTKFQNDFILKTSYLFKPLQLFQQKFIQMQLKPNPKYQTTCCQLQVAKQYLKNQNQSLNKQIEILMNQEQQKPFLVQNLQLSELYNKLTKTVMSSYDSFIENKSSEHNQNCLENIQGLFFDLSRHLDLDYQQNKDPVNKRTNYSENQQDQALRLKESIKCIDVPKKVIKEYLSAKKGRSTQTMELLHNFKTFIARKIKDLLLIKILNKKQTQNCISFMKSKPSFKSFSLLLHPISESQQLQKHLLDFFSSAQIFRSLMESKIRLSEKRKMIKFIEQIRNTVKNPESKRRWKETFKLFFILG